MIYIHEQLQLLYDHHSLSLLQFLYKKVIILSSIAIASLLVNTHAFTFSGDKTAELRYG